MTKEQIHKLEPNKSIVYHKHIGPSIQLVFKKRKDDLFYFSRLDYGLDIHSVEKSFELLRF